MAPLTYPAWFSDLDRIRVNEALDAATGLRTKPFPNRPGDLAVVFAFFYPSDDVAQVAVLAVLAVIVQILEEHRQLGDPSVRELHKAAHRFRADLVAWVAPARWTLSASPTPSLDAFTQAVYAAVDHCAWWERLLDVGRDDDAPTQPVTPIDDRPPLTAKAAAKRLGMSYATILRRIDDGTIQATRIGKILRVSVAELERLQTVPALQKFRYADRDPASRRRRK